MGNLLLDHNRLFSSDEITDGDDPVAAYGVLTVNEDEVQKAFDALSDRSNRFGVNFDELIDGQNADSADQSIAFVFTLVWIKTWAKAKEYSDYDGRNEMAVKLCREIAADPNFKALDDNVLRLWKLYSPAVVQAAEMFVSCSKREHRTLMQTETGFIFQLFASNGRQEVKRIDYALKHKYCAKWYELPLI